MQSFTWGRLQHGVARRTNRNRVGVAKPWLKHRRFYETRADLLLGASRVTRHEAVVPSAHQRAILVRADSAVFLPTRYVRTVPGAGVGLQYWISDFRPSTYVLVK